ncbi:hypothetical protein [Cellulomonas sp. NS3]|uniref:hypothetical protein n=1 Tax=Cellulomonas sp. NS3 TaxID=2973977 RepID=UPI002163EE9D|nr:hypothetical protein [Cellulomonas sp. NS3]
MSAAFSLNRSGFQYATDVLLFSTSIVDGRTAHLPDSGNLNGRTLWRKETVFYVPSAQNYGGTLINAEVTTENGVCYTGGPRVDGVPIS